MELTVLRNNLGPDERKWTFGQVLAVFLLLGVAAEVANILLAKLDSIGGTRSAEAVALQNIIQQPSSSQSTAVEQQGTRPESETSDIELEEGIIIGNEVFSPTHPT